MFNHFILTFVLALGLLNSQLFAVLQFDPIALYLTWQHNPESTMTIHWITDSKNTEDQIFYKSNRESDWQTIQGMHIPMPENYPYFIHRIELTHLDSATDYTFVIGQNGIPYHFRTMPTNLDNPIKFIVGGDIFHDDIESVKIMNHQAAKTSPHFALVGGDICYSNGKYACLQRWGLKKEKLDRWLKWLIAWKEQMVTPEGYLIPLITTIGNHDVTGGYNQTPDLARFYYAFFVPPGKHSYNVLDFSNYMSIIVLDSGHTEPVAGKQSKWLSEVLRKRTNIPNKFALYHVGAYPSVRDFDTSYNETIRKNWVSLFDKYNLNTAFEHHDHAYKRTHLLRNGELNEKGVLYMGDGAWGITKPRIPKPNRWYIAKSSATQHVIQVTVSSNSTHFEAIDLHGKTFDEFVHKAIP